jgi:hypothetical protein
MQERINIKADWIKHSTVNDINQHCKQLIEAKLSLIKIECIKTFQDKSNFIQNMSADNFSFFINHSNTTIGEDKIPIGEVDTIIAINAMKEWANINNPIFNYNHPYNSKKPL